MKPDRAREVLHALTQGIDPETGADLPKNAITFRSEIIRALYTAVAVFDQFEVRTKRRAQLPENVGVTWSPEEEQQLVTEFKAGEDIVSIAAKHQRTPRAIEARLERLGLITADQRTTQNSFTGTTKERTAS
ncbi:MAG: hypothetical protein JSR66_13200 [Proteobacteria bacterium]|nr:hypothetical protein [Pseudomonadota bacterium]